MTIAIEYEAEKKLELPFETIIREIVLAAVEDYFNPETGELMLGDIVISVDKVEGQAESYGHSQTRELAFLVAHSMLHLLGYDHMEEGERAEMERRQDAILESRGYVR